MPDRVVIINEGQRQMLACALALTVLDRPGWANALAEIADLLEAKAMVAEFVTYNRDRFHPDPLMPVEPVEPDVVPLDDPDVPVSLVPIPPEGQ